MTEYYHTLMEKGGRLLKTDFDNLAERPPTGATKMGICNVDRCGRDLSEARIRGCWRCGIKGDPQAAAAADMRRPPPRERGIDGPLWVGQDAGRSASKPAPLPSVDEWGNLDHGEDAE